MARLCSHRRWHSSVPVKSLQHPRNKISLEYETCCHLVIFQKCWVNLKKRNIYGSHLWLKSLNFCWLYSLWKFGNLLILEFENWRAVSASSCSHFCGCVRQTLPSCLFSKKNVLPYQRTVLTSFIVFTAVFALENINSQCQKRIFLTSNDFLHKLRMDSGL